MTSREVIRTIERAITAIRQYKRQSQVRLASSEERGNREQIESLSEILIRESFALGPAGETCPCCKGTGRK